MKKACFLFHTTQAPGLCYDGLRGLWGVVGGARLLPGSCSHIKRILRGGAWGAQPVERLALAQVTISRSVSSSPASGSLLSAQSLLQILCPTLSLPLPYLLSLFLSKINS